jgi:hypothetical protein
MSIIHFHDLVRIEAHMPAERSTDGKVEDEIETLVEWPFSAAGRVWRKSKERISIDIPRDLRLLPIYRIIVPFTEVGVVVSALICADSMIVCSCVYSAEYLSRFAANRLHNVQLTTLWP